MTRQTNFCGSGYNASNRELCEKTPTYKVKNFRLADLIKYLRDPSNVAAFVRDVDSSDAAYFEEAKADREAFAAACDEAAEKLTKGGKN